MLPRDDEGVIPLNCPCFSLAAAEATPLEKANIAALAPTVEGFEVLETWARGPMVINERIDRFTSGTLKSWHGVGVFVLRDGKIVEWYDYTIAMEQRG